MGKSVQDLINSGEIKQRIGEDDFAQIITLDLTDMGLTSLKGIEHFINLSNFICFKNKLTSIEEVSSIKYIRILDCRKNSLNTLKGIENLGLMLFMFDGNPCERKYKNLSTDEIQEKIKLEKHLKAGDERRGAASISDTGLFDFKIN